MPDPLTTEWIDSRIADAQTNAALDDAAKTVVTEAYTRALEHLKRVVTFRESTAEFTRLRDAAPAQLEAIRTELAAPPAEPVMLIPAEPEPLRPGQATTSQLEQMLAQQTADLAAARERLDALNLDLENRQKRSAAIPGEIAALTQKIESLNEEIESRASVVEMTPVVRSDLVEDIAARDAAVAERAMLTAEIESYTARTELIGQRVERAKRRINEAQRRVTAWQPIVQTRREADAAKAAQELKDAARAAALKHNVLATFSQETATFGERRTASTNRNSGLGETVLELTQRRNRIQTEYEKLQSDINDFGMRRGTGLLARRNLQKLPGASEMWRRVSRLEEMLDAIVADLIDVEQALTDVDDVDDAVEALVMQIKLETPNADLEVLEPEARLLVQQRKKLLTDFKDELEGEGKAIDRLRVALELLRNEDRDQPGGIGLIPLVTEYRRYIEERVFWVRSVSGSNLPDVSDAAAAAAWLFDPRAWYTGATRSLVAIARRPLVPLGVVILVGGLIAARAWARREIDHRAELVSRYRTDAFIHSLIVVGLTIIHAAFWPTIVLLASALLRLDSGEDPPAQVDAVARGLRGCLHTLIPLEILRQLARPRGLLESHFHWPAAGLKRGRRWLRLLTIPLVSMSALAWAMSSQNNLAWTESLGRMAFIVSQILIAVLLGVLMAPRGQTLATYLSRNAAGMMAKAKYVWYAFIVAVPLLLGLLSFLGFHRTATQIDRTIVDSVLLLVIIGVANGMMMRWLFLAQRRIAIDEARRKLAADAEQPIDEDAVDVPSISQKTRLLFRNALVACFFAGMVLTWNDVLPALQYLDRVELYPELRMLKASEMTEAPAPEPAPAQSTEARTESNATPLTPTTTSTSEAPADTTPFRLSLADVGGAMIAAIVAFFVFRHFPAFLEIVLLQRLPLDAGSRYAMSTIIRYVIAIIGAIVVFGALGLSWSKVQWLAAALTFGLAFGLQEIVANFVSGLIMLVERPVRVGDTVTVENISGTVTRIRMRATTILDWDRKELIIPNKTFITSQVINWTLSDTILRIICPVGVSYDADVPTVRKTLLQVAAKHPKILKDPEPRALFRRFSDSSLDFELRFFVPHIDDLVIVTDEVLSMTTEAFRKAGIEIAYPQMDLHLRDSSELKELKDHVKPMHRSEAK